MSTILQYNWQHNRMSEINARTFEEFLISGLIVHRKSYRWRMDKCDCWTDYVQPNNFFIDNGMRDFRGWDVSMLGEVHDIPFESLVSKFAECPDDVKRLKDIYHYAAKREYVGNNCEQFGFHKLMNFDFLCPPASSNLCRVIEVWNKETKPRYRCHDYNNGDFYKIDIEDFDTLVASVNRDRLQRGAEQGLDESDIPLIEIGRAHV